jgi:hypothetical protein
VLVRRGRAVGVRIQGGGEQVAARRAVLADVAAPNLYLQLLSGGQTPGRVRRGLRRFDWDWATVKVDWALDAPVPWTAADARRAPVVHVAERVDELSTWAAELARGLVPRDPFLVFGQYSIGDDTRAPAGKETAWAYTHAPFGLDVDVARIAERLEERVERAGARLPRARARAARRRFARARGREREPRRRRDQRRHRAAAPAARPAAADEHAGAAGDARRAPLPRVGLGPGGVHGGPGAIAARVALGHARARYALVAVGAAAAAATLGRDGA